MGIGNRIKLARVAKMLTQKQVAAHLNVSERTYQRYEADDFEPNIKTLLALADLFDVTTDYLLGREK